MFYKHEQLQSISTDEYFYLTENFEFVDAKTTEEFVKYLVYNKKKKLIDTVKRVMENELTEKERNIALDYWNSKLSVGQMSEKYHMSRSTFYRALDVIKRKLDASLKYVLFYNDAVNPPSTEDFLAQIKMKAYVGE